MRTKSTSLSGWGRVQQAPVRLLRPEQFRDLPLCLADVDGRGLVAYGAGRSYGDAALNSGGCAALTSRLNRMLAFDSFNGTLVCEAGVTFKDLADVFLPRGWFAPVSPGTAFVTMGGALANDVHGKNHEHRGSFGNHIPWFDLLTADGTVRRISREAAPDLFAATVGGIGLTGIVVQLALRLMPVASSMAEVCERRIADIDAFLGALSEERAAEYCVGWIDCLARGSALGRGILQTADIAGPSAPQPYPAKQRSVPAEMPSFVLNTMSVRAFNEFYFRRVPRTGRVRSMSLRRFLYPLDAIANWNRLYGRRGFYQFQAVIPMQQAPHGIVRLLETLSAARAASFLSVIKRLGNSGSGFLSFAMPGITLAVDIPASAGARSLIGRLHKVTLDHGGRVYLAKDALLEPADFRGMYPKLDRFVAALEAIDPRGIFQSDMSHRLAIRTLSDEMRAALAA